MGCAVTIAIETLARSVGRGQTAAEVLAAAADATRSLLTVDTSFVAVSDGSGGFPIDITNGIRDMRFRTITVRPGLGVGGQVLLRRAPFSVDDYASDPTITHDFLHVVTEVEGLHGMMCVPVIGPAGVEALLYAGDYRTGVPGDESLQALAAVASVAELTLDQLAAKQREVELALLRERQRVAIGLHDTVAQMLFAIGVSAHYSQRQRDPDALLDALGEIESTAASARQMLRSTLGDLSRSPAGIAFEARLEGEMRLAERTTGCRTVLTRRGDVRELPEPVESLLIDTLIEGIRNAAKHGRARVAVAHLLYDTEQVTLTLQADSAGDSQDWPNAGAGAGLDLLRARAAQLRGCLAREHVPDDSAIVRLQLPTRVPIGRSARGAES
jgi:signal transduction histidine kinase